MAIDPTASDADKAALTEADGWGKDIDIFYDHLGRDEKMNAIGSGKVYRHGSTENWSDSPESCCECRAPKVALRQ